MFCAVSLAALGVLKFHFDDTIESASAAPVVASGVDGSDGDGDRLRSSPAEPDFAGYEVIDGSRSDADGGLGRDPSGPETAVAGAVGEADADEVAGAATGVDGDGSGAGGGDGAGEGAAAGGDGLFVPDGRYWVDPASSGRPWSDLGAVDGLLTFRGNPTRTFHGRGPVPSNPRVLWEYFVGCSVSAVAGEAKEWCGTGWTGQPSVFRLPTSGEWTVAFGAYNRRVNFLDPATGAEALPPYQTNDIIKGSVTVDPDGFPLLYTGSRDNRFHVVALDGPEPQLLWELASDTDGPTLWNNDWDGSALVVDDHLFVGGENGRFYVVRLNRGYDGSGRVTVAPSVVFSTESWDDELLAGIRDQEVSVENSVAISGDTVYFANSGGLVQGWDVGGVRSGDAPQRVFRFWTGDDTDASIVVDDEGMLYVGSEYQRSNERSAEIGQIMKLDPSNPDDPLVWSREAQTGPDSGIYATAALHGDVVIVPTDGGELLGLDRATGEDRWRLRLPGPLWSSPVVIGDTLLQGDCGGSLNAFALDAAGVDEPEQLWSLDLGGCIESTPAVWDGQIFVGSRNGQFYAIGD